MIQANETAIIDYYLLAKNWLDASKYSDEIVWQDRQNFSDVTETKMLREHAWVVLNSGFREETIRKYFDHISLSFCDWENAHEIIENQQECYNSAFAVFRNKRKLEAIINMAKLISQNGFNQLIAKILDDPILALSSLPFVGHVTAWHLAKNLGIDVAKPDRHLVRLANKYGYDCVNQMCQYVAVAVGDRVAVVDLVFWRFEERRKGRNELRKAQQEISNDIDQIQPRGAAVG